MMLFMVSMVEDVLDESDVPDMEEEVERRNEERRLRGKREILPKREEGILIILICFVGGRGGLFC